VNTPTVNCQYTVVTVSPILKITVNGVTAHRTAYRAVTKHIALVAEGHKQWC